MTELSNNSGLIILAVNHKVRFFGGYVQQITNTLGDLRGILIATAQVVKTNIDIEMSRLAMCSNEAMTAY